MKTKLNREHQAAVNEIAKNAYIADMFGKLRSELVKANKDVIERHEADFRTGVPAQFEYEGLDIKCKLVMCPSIKWAAKEVVIYQK